MAQKKITDLQQRSSVVDACNFVVDDTVQSWRVTAVQLFNYLRGKKETTRTFTASTTIAATDSVLYLDPTAGGFTQDLPAVATITSGIELVFKNIASNGNTVILDPNGSEFIDSSSTLTLQSGEAVVLKNDGTKWQNISRKVIAAGSITSAMTGFTQPTSQRFLLTGSTTGRIFFITSGNATAGATYTNNGQTFTVIETITAGTILHTMGSGSPLSSGTLTKATGTGDSSITFSSSTATATYTTPAGAKRIRVRFVSAGGGASGSGTNSNTTNQGSKGGNSSFGLHVATGGEGGPAGNIVGVGAGGKCFYPVGFDGLAFEGEDGLPGGAITSGIAASGGGGKGGSSYFGGGGKGGQDTSAGQNAGGPGKPNTGSGGGGANSPWNTGGAMAGRGGGAGSYFEFWIKNPAASYQYAVGVGGSGGSAGSSGTAGAAGADGLLMVEEEYQ